MLYHPRGRIELRVEWYGSTCFSGLYYGAYACSGRAYGIIMTFSALYIGICMIGLQIFIIINFNDFLLRERENHRDYSLLCSESGQC